MARMPETLRNLISGDGSFSDRLIDWIDDLVDPSKPTKNPFKRAFIFEPLEERIVLNAAPTFVDLPEEITVVVGESYHVALNGQDADGDDLTFSTSSDLASVLGGNQSVRLKLVERDADGKVVREFGYITFQLFEGDVKAVTDRIKEIINSGFYESKIFHRVIDGFMVQGGSKSGTGTDGTGTKFDDMFTDLLRHNRQGMLSMANSGKNTNDSQFFITDAATTWLDDVHTIFGFMTSGYDVLEEVSKVKTSASDANPANRPLLDIVMEDVEVFTDTQNGVLRIKTDASMVNKTQVIKVMVDDGNGNKIEREIKVKVAPKAEDLTLDTPETVEVRAGGSIVVDMPGLDNISPEDIRYYIEAYSGSHQDMKYELTADNKLKITAGKGVSGVQYLWVGVYDALDGWIRNSDSSGKTIIDGAFKAIVVLPAAPEVTWTDGDNGVEDDGITSNNNKDDDTSLTFTVENVIPQATIKLYANGVEVPFKIVSEICYDAEGKVVPSTSQNIEKRTLIIKTAGSAENKLNDGTYNFTVKQFHYQVNGDMTLESELSTPIKVIIATVAPEFISPPDGFLYDAAPGEELVIDVKTNKDGSDSVTIEFVGDKPEGMSYDAENRKIKWTPAADIEKGDYTFTLKVTDGAGNSRTTTVTIAVQDGPQFEIVGNTEADEETTVILELNPVEGEEPLEGNLTYEIESSTLPEDANVSLTTGDDGRSALFTWTTTEADGPGIYTVTFKVTDENGNTRKKMLQLTINETNKPPYFDAEDFEEEYHVNEHEELVINIKARDDDVPKNAITYQFLGDNIPEGMEIDAKTGKLTWTPGEQYGGQAYEITIEATDEHGAKAEYKIRIVIEETDDPPVFTEIGDISVYDDLGELIWIMKAADPDIPTNTVTYSLVGDVPEGMTINPSTGEIKWVIPTGYAGEQNPFLTLNIEVKATEVIRTIEENEDGEKETVETDGLSTSYIVTLTIFSREYEYRQMAAADMASTSRTPFDIPGLPQSISNSLQFRDMPGSAGYFNMQRANATVETPTQNPDVNTMFRDRFDTISFGDDIVGSGEVAPESQTPSREADQSTQPPPASETTNYRSRRPIPSGAILRSVESGLSRVSTPLLDALDNVDVGRAVSEVRDAGQSIQTLYSNTATYTSGNTTASDSSAHDAALRNWGGGSSTGHSQETTPANNSREQFRSMRLK